MTDDDREQAADSAARIIARAFGLDDAEADKRLYVGAARRRWRDRPSRPEPWEVLIERAERVAAAVALHGALS